MKKDLDFQKWKKARDASWTLREGDRERYARLVRKVSNAGGTKRRGKGEDLMRPVMRLRQSMQTFLAQLTGGEVRFQCEYPNEARDRFARIQEAHLNELCSEMQLSATLASAVTSSFFKEGIVMLHYAEGKPLLMGTDTRVVPGRPAAVNIPWVDYNEDMTANHPSRRQWMCHFYDVATNELEDNPAYNQDVVRKMKEQKPAGSKYDERENEQARNAYGFSPNDERLAFPTTKLCDFYVPHLHMKYTFDWRMNFKPLREEHCEDPDGPYRKLVLEEIPDNIMACSQAEALEHLEELVNSAWRKISMTMAAAKDLILYEEGEQDSADLFRTAKHGQAIKVRNIDGVRRESFGGPNKNLTTGAVMADQMMNDIDNNLALRSGSGAQSPTASQDQLLAQSSGTLTGYNLQKILEFYSSVGNGIRRLMWDDESMVRDTTYEHKKLPGYKLKAPWRPGVRDGERDDYRCKIVPHTIRFTSPEEKAAKVLNTLDRLQPYMGMFQQAGRAPDPDVILDVLGDAGLPEMKKLFQVVDPVEPSGSGERPLQSANTTRTQIRKSESGQNPMMQMAAGMDGE